MSNNRYHSCPALMEDGRFLSDARPESEIYNKLTQNLMNNSNYRRSYAIKHGNQLITYAVKKLLDDSKCNQKQLSIPIKIYRPYSE